MKITNTTRTPFIPSSSTPRETPLRPLGSATPIFLEKTTNLSMLGMLALKAKSLTDYAWSTTQFIYGTYSDYFPRLQFFSVSPISNNLDAHTFCKALDEHNFFTHYFSQAADLAFENYRTLKSGVDALNNHRTIVQIRYVFVIKQTCDFSLTLSDWILGKKSNSSLLYQTVNTALSWSPMAYKLISESDSPFLLNCFTAASGAALAYSFARDYLAYTSPDKYKETSPVNTLLSQTARQVRDLAAYLLAC
jgi:hypothetical protein